MSRIRAVTFDVAGTLIEPHPSVGAVYSAALRRLDVGTLEAPALEFRFQETWRARGTFDYSRVSWAGLLRRVFDGVVDPADFDRAFEAVWLRFAEADAWRVHDDVNPCLDFLRRRGIRRAVVSNWDERLHAVMHAIGLAPGFEFILPSVEGAGPKPEPRLFLEAVERLGLNPGEVLHVGDSFREDVQGAREAGLAVCWLRRGVAGSGLEPGSISTLGDLKTRL